MPEELMEFSATPYLNKDCGWSVLFRVAEVEYLKRYHKQVQQLCTVIIEK
jgi:hypothetical protein